MKSQLLVVRADGGGSIGAGHISRCASVAEEFRARGGEVVFAVSNDTSAVQVIRRGFRSVTLSGDRLELSVKDGAALARLAVRERASSILVDSYAADYGFYESLRDLSDARIAAIDDGYTFAGGVLQHVRRLPVDVLVSYSFGALPESYRSVYDGACRLLVGPRYAPVRASIRAAVHEPRFPVQRVLITTGATNPGGLLERFASAATAALPGATVDVVVGASARFDGCVLGANQLVLHRGLGDLAPLMAAADIALTAAGSTLYELACAGVPAVAAPIVENQLPNAAGYAAVGCGVSLPSVGWSEKEACCGLARLASEQSIMAGCSTTSRRLVDGLGARRIAAALWL